MLENILMVAIPQDVSSSALSSSYLRVNINTSHVTMSNNAKPIATTPWGVPTLSQSQMSFLQDKIIKDAKNLCRYIRDNQTDNDTIFKLFYIRNLAFAAQTNAPMHIPEGFYELRQVLLHSTKGNMAAYCLKKAETMDAMAMAYLYLWRRHHELSDVTGFKKLMKEWKLRRDNWVDMMMVRVGERRNDLESTDATCFTLVDDTFDERDKSSGRVATFDTILGSLEIDKSLGEVIGILTT